MAAEVGGEAVKEAEGWLGTYDDGPGGTEAAEKLRHALKEAGL